MEISHIHMNQKKIMEQADSIINPRKWSKEEKSMFDEKRRDFDGYYAYLAYVREEKEKAIAECTDLQKS